MVANDISNVTDHETDSPSITNFQANLDRLASLHELFNAGMKRDLLAPLAKMQKRLETTKWEMPALLKFTEKGTTRFKRGVKRTLQQHSLVYGWYCVMMVAFIEAYLEESLIVAAIRNPRLLKNAEPLSCFRVGSADSLENLQEEVRQQWAKQTLTGGPGKWLKSLEAMGARGYTKDCKYRIGHLWDTRNLVVHSQGLADAAYLKRHKHPDLKRGSLIVVSAPQIQWWNQGVSDFVNTSESFFSSYGKKRQVID